MFAYATASERVDAATGQQRDEEISTVGERSTDGACSEMEGGYRGYLLSGDESLLVSYRRLRWPSVRTWPQCACSQWTSQCMLAYGNSWTGRVPSGSRTSSSQASRSARLGRGGRHLRGRQSALSQQDIEGIIERWTK